VTGADLLVPGAMLLVPGTIAKDEPAQLGSATLQAPASVIFE